MVAGDLRDFDAVFQDEALRAVIVRPELPMSMCRQITARLSEGRQELITNLLASLCERRRLALLVDLRAAFDELVLASRGEVNGVLETARPLGDAERSAMEAVASKVSGRKVHLTVQDAPELLGGVRLRVGNTLWDGSAVAQLESLRQRLLEVPIASS